MGYEPVNSVKRKITVSDPVDQDGTNKHRRSGRPRILSYPTADHSAVLMRFSAVAHRSASLQIYRGLALGLVS